MLEEILSSEFCEAENQAEWFRLLLHREWNKRKGLGVPSSQFYSTAFRNGRPSERFGVKVSIPVTVQGKEGDKRG